MPSTAVRENIIAKARKVVVKVGTNSICHERGGVNLKAVEALALQVAALMQRGLEVTLVSSGAIGTGIAELGLSARPTSMPMLQATAAIGQGQLMRVFRDVFAAHDIKVAQVLVTRDAFEERTRYLNIRNTLGALADLRALPIINENDTVAVDEIRFGENDVLAAMVANMLCADLLVLLSNVDGVLKDGAVLDVIQQVDDQAMGLAFSSKSKLGSGGMSTKLSAAGLVTRAGAVAVIANANAPRVLERLIDGEKVGTVFIPAKRRMSSRRRWIGSAAKASGKIMIDDGAVKAIREKGTSLLPSGIRGVLGKFAKGATVVVIDMAGRQVARGLTNYSADQVDKIKGLRTTQIAKVLGEKIYDEVIHRNNMMVS